MNALDLLQAYLQRASAGGNLADLGAMGGGFFRDNRDTHVLAPGQSSPGGLGNFMHPNALGIYAREPRPPPAGDEVIRAGLSPAGMPVGMPAVSAANDQRLFSQQTQPSYFPGPDGSTRIAMPPSPDLLAQLQRWWSATQEPQQSALNQMMSR